MVSSGEVVRSSGNWFNQLDGNRSCRHSDPRNYFTRTKVSIYIEDAISQWLNQKEDEDTRTNPNKFFFSYFISVKNGSHILFREFSFVSATLHSRLCFIRNYWKCFNNIGKRGDPISAQEYHSLALLLCPDFPWSIVQKTCRMSAADVYVDALLTFPDFIYSFNLQFPFHDFLCRCLDEASPLVSSSDRKANDRMDSKMFLKKIRPLCEDGNLESPPLLAVEEVLSGFDNTTFCEFLAALSRHRTFLKFTDTLPPRADVYKADDKHSKLSQADESWD